MGLSRTVPEKHGDFSQKLHIFLTPRVFCAPLKEFPLELGIGTESQQTTPCPKISDTPTDKLI